MIERQKKKNAGTANSRLFHNSGVFPSTVGHIKTFAETYYSAVRQFDIAILWMPNRNLDQILYRNLTAMRGLKALSPWYWKRPYTELFENKKVLIISPFKPYIADQLNSTERRECIFPNNSRVLMPWASLEQIQAPLPPTSKSGKFNSTWKITLDNLIKEMDTIEYDVMIAGAGAYALPLAAHAKKQGKVGIHLGGNLGPLFGLKGGRFDKTDEYIHYFYNSCWVRMRKPQGGQADRMEKSAYWRRLSQLNGFRN